MRKNSLLLSASILLSLCAFGASGDVYSQSSPEFGYDVNYNYSNFNLQSYALYVPAGVKCQGILSQAISSQSAVVGQSVDIILKDGFTYNGKIIAPAGSVVQGSIASNQKAAKGKLAKTMIRFTTIVTPYGNIIPINAILATADNSGLLVGKTQIVKSAKNEKKDGEVIASNSKRSILKRALPISISANSPIELYFTQPITFTAQ